MSKHEFEPLFVSELETIARITSIIARRHWLSADEAEEFRSIVHLRLVDDDYAVLRKFKGRSSLRTFLAVVIQRIFLDEQVARWGKWRPSAQARREGAAGILLERLTVRDHLSFAHACALMTSVHGVDLSVPDLEAMYVRLPRMHRPRLVDEAALANEPSPDPSPAELVEASSQQRLVLTAARALASEVGNLPDEDRLILKLRFVDGLTMRDICRRISASGRADFKAFYRRMARLIERLRAGLEHRGLQREDVLGAIGGIDVAFSRASHPGRPGPT